MGIRRKPESIAAGLGCKVEGRDGRRIVIGFDDDTFSQVRAIAVKRNVSFAEVIRELVEFGLLDLEDAA